MYFRFRFLLVVARKIPKEELVVDAESEPLLLPNNTIEQSNDVISTSMAQSPTEDESQSNIEPLTDTNIL